jgi:transcriptional regulator with XRE-family HTH domain
MIRTQRKELGLTQIELAAQVEIEGRTVSQAHIADLERGYSVPRAEVIEQLARWSSIAMYCFWPRGSCAGHGRGTQAAYAGGESGSMARLQAGVAGGTGRGGDAKV